MKQRRPRPRFTAASATMQLLADVERGAALRPSMLGRRYARAARTQAEATARAAKAGRCHLHGLLAARAALARADADPGTPYSELAAAQREVDALAQTFSAVCVVRRLRTS
jgi:hypothetical protein